VGRRRVPARSAPHHLGGTQARPFHDRQLLEGARTGIPVAVAELEDGTIGGSELNAADFQIATSTALLATMDDLRPLLEGRSALDHARRVAPRYPGRLPEVFPAAWLPA
jgi:hypothetical protein